MEWVSSSHLGLFSSCPFPAKRSSSYYRESSIAGLVHFKWLVVCEAVRKPVAGSVQVPVCQRSRSRQLYVFNTSAPIALCLESGSFFGGGARSPGVRQLRPGHASTEHFRTLLSQCRSGHPEGPSDPGSHL